MFSRKSAKLLGQLFTTVFVRREMQRGHRDDTYRVLRTRFYDFLYEREYAAWFCNSVRRLSHSERSVKEFIMQLHTGETLAKATPDFDWKQRERLGQRYLEDTAQDMLRHWEGVCRSGRTVPDAHDDFLRQLELDGYKYQDGQLLRDEEDAVEVEESKGILHRLYDELSLGNRKTALHHLDLSEDHYLNERWDDSIGNSRKFLECVLQEVADKHSILQTGTPLPERTKNTASQVRDCLESATLLESKEKEALAKVYGVLSDTGSHPYMAKSDQARLFRHLALTFSQFVMLRFRGQRDN